MIPDHLQPALDAVQRIVTEAFDDDLPKRLILLSTDGESLAMHSVGASQDEIVQIMEMAYQLYRSRSNMHVLASETLQ